MHISHAKIPYSSAIIIWKGSNLKAWALPVRNFSDCRSIKYKDHRLLEDGTTTRIEDGRQWGCPNIPDKDEFPATSTSSPRIINHLSRLNFMLMHAFKFLHQKFHDFPITVSENSRNNKNFISLNVKFCPKCLPSKFLRRFPTKFTRTYP